MLPLNLKLRYIRIGTKGDVERLHVFGMVVEKGVRTDTPNGEGVPRLINANTGLNLLRRVTIGIHCAARHEQ